MSSANTIADVCVGDSLDVSGKASPVSTIKPTAHLLSEDAILSAARRAGMLVMLDGQIGHERYQSVTGSLSSLHRFAAELHRAILESCTV